MKLPKPKRDLILLGGGTESLPIIHRASQDYRVIVVDQNAQSPGILWAKSNPELGVAWLANVYSSRSCLRTAQMAVKFAAKATISTSYDFAGVMCAATDAPDSQAWVAETLGLPSIGRAQAELGRDKWRQYEWLKAHNIPVPESKLLEKTATVADAESYDLIKPLAGRGARGVQRIIPSDFNNQKYRALAESLPGYKQLIAQKWITGDQLSTESVIHNGNITFTAVALRNYDKLDTYYPFVVENGADMPFHLSPEQHSNLTSLILRATLALGWDNLTVKCDIVMSQGAFFLIEIAPRLSGGYFCSHYIPSVYDYDIIGAAIDLATGSKNVREYEYDGYSYVSQRFLFPKSEWIGKKIKQMPLVADAGSIVLYTNYKKAGDTIMPVTYHGTRLAQVITRGNSQSQAKRDAEKVIEQCEALVEVE